MLFSSKIKLSVCVALIVSVLFSVISFAKTSEEIRNDVLRLHVIANSDSAIDQNLKLRVRDALLQSGNEIFDGTTNVENAIKRITPQIPVLEEIARNIIKESGFDYDVRITVSKEYFTTRTYEDITLPAGKYRALRVIIGSGKGHNWWCVMFPAMCLPAAESRQEIDDVLNSRETKLVEKNPKLEPRFKIIEIIEQLKKDKN